MMGIFKRKKKNKETVDLSAFAEAHEMIERAEREGLFRQSKEIKILPKEDQEPHRLDDPAKCPCQGEIEVDGKMEEYECIHMKKVAVNVLGCKLGKVCLDDCEACGLRNDGGCKKRMIHIPDGRIQCPHCGKWYKGIQQHLSWHKRRGDC